VKVWTRVQHGKPIIFYKQRELYGTAVKDVEVDFRSILDHDGAVFSEDETYRYLLWRIWNPARPLLGWLLLNPSTADHELNDNTMDRCNTRAKNWGYGGQITANIFAVRSRDPRILYAHPDPIGPLNDAAIGLCARSTQRLICGWGGHGKLRDRGAKVLGFLREHSIIPYALDIGMNGQPKHPLYLSYDLMPKAMK
jgi:hypothetical protein